MATRRFYIYDTKLSSLDAVIISELIGPNKDSCKAAFTDSAKLHNEIQSFMLANTQASSFHSISRKYISHVSHAHGTITW